MDHRFDQPDGFAFGSFKNADGRALRYGVSPVQDPKGNVVIFPGFRECAEKYFETVRELNAEGYNVFVFDWIGQGGSDRFVKDAPQRAHSEGYVQAVADARQFIDQIVKPASADKPLVALAHSMGAHRALYLMKDDPDLFAAASFSAPMFDIQTGAFPKSAARSMARFAKAGNYLEKYIPGGGDWNAGAHPFKGNKLTGDESRYIQSRLYEKNPALTIGDATYGWVYHTFQSIDIVNQESFLRGITTPIFMGIAGDDRIVDTKAQDRASILLPDCKKHVYPGARHEILMEQDAIRGDFLKRTLDLFQDAIAKAALSPKKPDAHKAARKRLHFRR